MSKRNFKVHIAVWVLLLALLGGYYLFFAPRSSEYSPEENRNLAGFPAITAESVFSGKFGQEMESWLLDRFPGRNLVISFVNRFQSLLSFASHEEYLQIADKPDDPLDNDDYQDDLDDLLGNLTPSTTVPPTTQPETTAPTTEPSTTETVPTEPKEDPPIVQKPAVNLSDFPDRLGVYMDRGKGESAILTHARDNVAAVTAVLNKYAALLPENGKLMFTVVPQSTYANLFVNAADKVSFYADWDDLVNGMGADNVYAFDTAEILADAIRAGEYVYFRTDMHWNPYGSYLVYSQMAKQAGKTPCSYTEDFDLTVEDPFRGTYYRDNPSAYMGVEPDVLDLLMPKFDLEWRRITSGEEYKLIDFLDFNARANDRYTVYLGGPAGPWTYAECDNGQEENCLVITDSFGLGFIPFLTTNYGQVHYYDARYFSQDATGCTVAEMMEKYDIQDIYVVVGDLHSFDSSFILSSVNNQLGAK